MEQQPTAGYWLSPTQKRTWLSQSENALPNAGALVLLDGDVRPAELRAALSEVVSRHEALRTVYRRPAGMKVPFQVVLPAAGISWELIDLTGMDAARQGAGLEQIFRSELGRSFDLQQGPILSACLVTLGDSRSALILGLSPLAADAPSLTVLVQEAGLIYAGRRAELSEDPFRYVQFAQWQNELLEADDETALSARAHWLQQTAAGRIALPQESVPAGALSFQPETIETKLPAAAAAGIRTVAAKHGASTAEVLLAAWQSLIWRLAGQTVFHTHVFFGGREYEELAGAIGLIGKFLPVPARFDGDYSFGDVVDGLHAAMASAAEWQEYFVPAEESADQGAARPAEDLPLAFDYAELASAQTYGDVTFAIARQESSAQRFRLKLSARRIGEDIVLQFHFDAARLPREAVERWSGHFETLLAGAVQDPERLVGALPLLTEAERQLLLTDWNRTEADYPREQCLHQLFEAQAARTPGRPAVRCGAQHLTYQELNESANRLARHLRQLGVGPNARVGLCLDRGIETIAGLLAILKAGGAYVPLSADNPKARLSRQMDGIAVLLTESKFLAQLPQPAGPTLCMDTDQDQWSHQAGSNLPADNPECQAGPDNLVYAIYTSGSTGVPKGVAVRHRNLVNYAWFIARLLDLESFHEGLHFATVSTLSADLGNTCIYPSLISGGCLHVIPYETSADSRRFAGYVAQYPVDVLKIVPSHLAALLDSSHGAAILPRKFLLLGGESLTSALLKQIDALQPSCQIFNHYGPTETTVGSLTLRLKDFDWRNSQAIPIGRPIANTRVYILDARWNPMPAGVPGDLYIAGDGVTAGYLDQPGLTAERFLADPFGAGEMYRTGDLARYLPGGNVEFLGRGDDQVKIRGFRIELGEVEAVLAGHPSVRQVVVIAKPDNRGGKRLIAYVVAQVSTPASSEDLRGYLKERLPDYMVPAAIVVLPKLPLNANGKIDRENLPEPGLAPVVEHAAPVTPAEIALAAIWSEVLSRGGIGIKDNFFDMGGHSLAAIQIISRVREQFHLTLDIQTVFDRPTIQGIAQAIDERAQAGLEDSSEPDLIPVSREAYRVK